MLSHSVSTFGTIVGAVIVCAFVIAVVRAAILFGQGFEDGFAEHRRPKDNLQSLFSKDD
jgi:hypothetical protein